MSSGELVAEWTPEMLASARAAFRRHIEHEPVGEKRALVRSVVASVAAGLDRESDEDALGDGLNPFELFPEVLGLSAEDGSTAFMGPNYLVFTVLKAGDSDYLVVDDRMETGEYELLSVASTLERACEVIGETAIGGLGINGPVRFSNGAEVDPKEAEEADESFWSARLLEEPRNG